MNDLTHNYAAGAVQPSKSRQFWGDAWRKDQRENERQAERYRWDADRAGYFTRTAAHYKRLADRMEGLA